jgi:hypothetical protein
MRAAYRGYWTGGKRAGQVRRLHIIREHGPGDRVAKEFMCGAPAWDCTHSDVVISDQLPVKPPEGLAWCPHCIGRAAEAAGLLGGFGEQLARATIAAEALF